MASPVRDPAKAGTAFRATVASLDSLKAAGGTDPVGAWNFAGPSQRLRFLKQQGISNEKATPLSAKGFEELPPGYQNLVRSSFLKGGSMKAKTYKVSDLAESPKGVWKTGDGKYIVHENSRARGRFAVRGPDGPVAESDRSLNEAIETINGQERQSGDSMKAAAADYTEVWNEMSEDDRLSIIQRAGGAKDGHVARSMAKREWGDWPDPKWNPALIRVMKNWKVFSAASPDGPKPIRSAPKLAGGLEHALPSDGARRAWEDMDQTEREEILDGSVGEDWSHATWDQLPPQVRVAWKTMYRDVSGSMKAAGGSTDPRTIWDNTGTEYRWRALRRGAPTLSESHIDKYVQMVFDQLPPGIQQQARKGIEASIADGVPRTERTSFRAAPKLVN